MHRVSPEVTFEALVTVYDNEVHVGGWCLSTPVDANVGQHLKFWKFFLDFVPSDSVKADLPFEQDLMVVGLTSGRTRVPRIPWGDRRTWGSVGVLDKETRICVVPRVVVGCALSRGRAKAGWGDVEALAVFVNAWEIHGFQVDSQVVASIDDLAHPSVSFIFNIITFQVPTPYIVLVVQICGCNNSY